jgi:hypothetical protein
MMSNVMSRACGLAAVLMVAGLPAGAWAATVGGHIGIASPLVTVTEDDSTNIADDFKLVNPIGVTVKLTDRLAIDFETQVVSKIDPEGPNGFVVDPGVIYNFGPFAAGLRIAWQIGTATSNVGVIPLINKGLAPVGGGTWFVEAAFPTFLYQSGVPSDIEFNVVFHTGIGF